MRILVVSRWLWEERRRNGGQPGFFGELAKAIVGQGIEMTVLSQAYNTTLTPKLQVVDGLNEFVFSRDHRKSSLWAADKVVKSWAGYRKAATDASVISKFVHDHGPFDVIVAQCEEPDGLACALAAKFGKGLPPLVTFVHDLRYEFCPEGVRFIRKSSLGFIFRRSARIIANSLQTASWLEREYGVPARKIGQCRIHLTSPFLKMATSTPTDMPDADSHRILFLGALNRKKAPDLFLQAAQQLAAKLPGWKFVLVGSETSEDRAFRAELDKFKADPALAGCTEWLGRLAPSAVINEIRRARVVVCPSRIETFSRTTIEALALNRPVIVTDTTGAAQWVQSTGCGAVVPANDPNALANAILEWTAKPAPPGACAAVTSQLTASLAAQDFIREVKAALAR